MVKNIVGFKKKMTWYTDDILNFIEYTEVSCADKKDFVLSPQV